MARTDTVRAIDVDILVKEYLPLFNIEKNHFTIESDFLSQYGRPLPAYLHQLHVLCPYEPFETITALFAKFEKEVVAGGSVLWKQGDRSTRAVLLRKGILSSILEEDVGQFVSEDVSEGHLVRNLTFIINFDNYNIVLYLFVKDSPYCIYDIYYLFLYIFNLFSFVRHLTKNDFYCFN